MGICKGNVGNLMQHWVLVETLRSLAKCYPTPPTLSFVASHGMAPWSVPEDKQSAARATFDRVRSNLDRNDSSPFETYWRTLSGLKGLPYPSSASLVLLAWPGRIRLTVCEKSAAVAAEIEAWARLPEVSERCPTSYVHSVFRGDWRDRFPQGLAPDASLTFVEMDPMRFECHDPASCRRDDRAAMYPEDLDILAKAVERLRTPVVVQLSSYSANNGNGHDLVRHTVTSSMEGLGFTLKGTVTPDGNLISFVFARGVNLWPDAGDLDGGFGRWLKEALNKCHSTGS